MIFLLDQYLKSTNMVSCICSIFLKIKQFTGPLKWHEILRIYTYLDILCYLQMPSKYRCYLCVL